MIVTTAAVLACVFTYGGALAAFKLGFALGAKTLAGAAAAGTTVIALGAGAVAGGITAAGIAIDGAIQAGSSAESVRRETVGSGQSDSWNYQETITTNFDMETLQCRKFVRTQNCADPHEPLFGKMFCKSWEEPVETCSTIQF